MKFLYFVFSIFFITYKGNLIRNFFPDQALKNAHFVRRKNYDFTT